MLGEMLGEILREILREMLGRSLTLLAPACFCRTFSAKLRFILKNNSRVGYGSSGSVCTSERRADCRDGHRLRRPNERPSRAGRRLQ